jgi:hypothetical protein
MPECPFCKGPYDANPRHCPNPDCLREINPDGTDPGTFPNPGNQYPGAPISKHNTLPPRHQGRENYEQVGDRITERLKKERELLRGQYRALNEKVDEARAELNCLTDQLAEIEAEGKRISKEIAERESKGGSAENDTGTTTIPPELTHVPVA